MNQRGANTLYKDIFGDTIPALTIAGDETPVRQKKISCMIDWYYYMGRKTRFNYNYLLEIMEPVFFLSPRTIHDTFQENREQLLSVKREWKNEDNIDRLRKHFSSKWPHLVW